MTDLATLGLAVDSREVVDASKDLDRIRDAAGRAEKQADSFGKRVADAGKRAAAANDNSARAAERAAKAYDGYSRAAQLAARAIGAVVGAAAGKALISFADTWSDISSRVGIAIKNMDAAPAVLDRIAQTARMTYSSLDLTAEGFVRNAMVLNELGKSTQQQLDYQEALNNALVVSGAKGQAAEFVQESLNRSMALGKMRGVELNNVLNYGGRVAELLAKHFNTTTGGLMKLAQQGKITGDVLFNVLTKNMVTLREEAESMPATFGDGLLLIRNALMQFIGSTDQALGASETLAAGLIVIADNIGRVVATAATAVTAFGVYYVGAMVAAYVSTMTLSGALVLLRAALIRTGIGALIIGAGELVYRFGRLVSAAGGFGEAMGLLGDLASEVWERIKLDANSAYLGVQAVWEKIKLGWLTALSVMQERWANFLHNIAGAAMSVPGMEETALSIRHSAVLAGSAYYETETAIAAARTEVERLAAASEDAAEKARAPLESIAAIRKVLADAAAGGEIPNTPGVRAPTTPDVDKAAEKAKKAYAKIVLGAKEFIATQELERQALGMTEQEANRLRYTQDLLNDAKRAGIKLSVDQTAELERLGKQMADTEAQTSALKRAFDFAKDLTRGFMNDLRSGLEQGKSFWESFGNAALNALDKIVDKLLNDVIDALFQVNNAGSNMGGGGILGFLGGLLGIGGGLSLPATAPIPMPRPFSAGGYTGPGTASQPAGIVHAGEYVFSKAAVDRIGLGYLEGLHSSAKGYMNGGYVRSHAPANVNMRGYQSGGHVRAAPSEPAQPAYQDNRTYKIDARGAQAGVGEEIRRALVEYDREVLPARVNQIAADPHARG